ncbi:hypothetical protein EYF80_015834 [Liparis tanakae]|uniref:Uncharacterized protein n=1 Tax=Liparis tanakae TaxID=230148 RepID=A0A4Z2IA52_9TELE|nr:hypothetical protein EYF80_015834 [Liparis tanakae]
MAQKKKKKKKKSSATGRDGTWTEHALCRPFGGGMYERHRRRYSFCAKGERTVDVVLIKIQRERDVFCPETNTVTTCTDVNPDIGECVSVCLLHRDKDGVRVPAEPDDGVFKRPQVPPCVGHRDKGVGVSRTSTDDASTRRALSPTEGALPVGTPDAVTPRSSRLSWKSETEDRGKACRLVFYVSQQKQFFDFQYDSRNVFTFNNKKRQIV